MALQHEENRCGYLDSQKGMMTAIHEEMATMPEGKDQLTLPKLLRNYKFGILKSYGRGTGDEGFLFYFEHFCKLG